MSSWAVEQNEPENAVQPRINTDGHGFLFNHEGHKTHKMRPQAARYNGHCGANVPTRHKFHEQKFEDEDEDEGEI